jgi:hypothetical protein
VLSTASFEEIEKKLLHFTESPPQKQIIKMQKKKEIKKRQNKAT